MNTVAHIIDNIRLLTGDFEKPYKYPDNFILNLMNQIYGTESVGLKLLHKKDTIAGDGTGRYSLAAKLTYTPSEIKRIFIDTTEAIRIRKLHTDVLEGTPAASTASAEASNIYVWNKVSLSDVTTEQTLITAAGNLTLANLDSGQTALPTFSGDVEVRVGSGYQDRTAFKSTTETISGGNVTFGITLSSAGTPGVPYFDILIRQM